VILFYLALVGATLVIVRGSIFKGLRARVKFLACAQCSGWWIGALGAQVYPSADLATRVRETLIMAFVTSVLAMTTDILHSHFAGGEPDPEPPPPVPLPTEEKKPS
jgi:hypothetical protein